MLERRKDNFNKCQPGALFSPTAVSLPGLVQFSIFTARAGDAARHVLLRTLEQLLRLRAENVLCSEHLRAEVQDRVDRVDRVD